MLVSGWNKGRLRVIDPHEGERWIDLLELEKDFKAVVQSLLVGSLPATKRFDISYFSRS